MRHFDAWSPSAACSITCHFNLISNATQQAYICPYNGMASDPEDLCH